MKTLPKGKKRNDKKTQILLLLDEFISYSKQYPEEAADKAYNRKAAAIKELGGSETQIEILEKGCAVAKSAPQCALGLADIYYDRAEYEQSLKYLEVCIPSADKPQPDINPEYVYLLRGLVKKAILMKKVNGGSFIEFEDEIRDIYRDFHIVLDLKGASRFKVSAEENLKVLIRQTGIDDNEKNKAQKQAEDYI